MPPPTLVSLSLLVKKMVLSMSFCYKLILPSFLGFFMESFECALPNGFHYSGAEGSTFLDAVYVENLSTYFVLDALQVPWTSG